MDVVGEPGNRLAVNVAGDQVHDFAARDVVDPPESTIPLPIVVLADKTGPSGNGAADLLCTEDKLGVHTFVGGNQQEDLVIITGRQINGLPLAGNGVFGTRLT